MTYALVVGGTKEAVDVRLLEWHADPGDAVSPGDLIVELETHKVIVEVRAQQPEFCVASCAMRANGESSETFWQFSATNPTARFRNRPMVCRFGRRASTIA